MLAEKKLVVIQHEEIPGFMAAMTMSFHVSDDIFSQLAPGTPVVGTLLPRKDGGWHLTEVRVVAAPGATLAPGIPYHIALNRDASGAFHGIFPFRPTAFGDWRVCIDQRTACVEVVPTTGQGRRPEVDGHAAPDGFAKAHVYALKAGEAYEVRVTKSPALEVDLLIQSLSN